MSSLEIDLARSEDVCVYYLAGPMSGIPDYNYPAFEKAAADLRGRGFVIKSPHEIDHGESEETPRGSKPWTEYMIAAIQLLLTCDAVVLLEGWANSQGALEEFRLAKRLGMDCILYYPNVETFEVI